MIRSEVTLVNNSATALKGQLLISVDHCWPLTNYSKGSKRHAQSVSATGHGPNRTDHPASGQKQSTVTTAEHITAEQSPDSSRLLQRQGGLVTKARHSVAEGDHLTWTESVSIPPGSTIFSMRDQILQSPHLWWPLKMGKQVYPANFVPLHFRTPRLLFMHQANPSLSLSTDTLVLSAKLHCVLHARIPSVQSINLSW